MYLYSHKIFVHIYIVFDTYQNYLVAFVIHYVDFDVNTNITMEDISVIFLLNACAK